MKGLCVFWSLLILFINGCCAVSCCGDEILPVPRRESIWLPSTIKAEVKNHRLELVVDYGVCNCGKNGCLIKPSKQNLDFLVKELNRFVGYSSEATEKNCFSVSHTEGSKGYLTADQNTFFPIKEVKEFYPMSLKSRNRAALRVYYVVFESVESADQYYADTGAFLLSINQMERGLHGEDNMVSKPHRPRDEKTAERMFFLDELEELRIPSGVTFYSLGEKTFYPPATQVYPPVNLIPAPAGVQE